MKVLMAFCLLVTSLWSGQSLAQTVGYVKTVVGDAQIISAGVAKRAVVGTPLAAGDIVKTEEASSLGLTLKDNTLMSFGPTTQFILEDYLFSPTKGDLKLGGSISRGTMHYVSGAIAHLKAEAVQFKTPTGTIGVRGTRFVVVVE